MPDTQDLSRPPAASAGDAGYRFQLMETFVRIVESGSLSAAAEQLNATQPTVSRRLQALERSLGVRLLHRTTHSMRLTVDGERCFKRAKELLASWASFEADLRGAQQEPEGLLRVAVPHAFGQTIFVGPLVAFVNAHPRVTVEWLLKDEVPDFLGSGIDCAIHVGEPADPSVVALRIADVPRIVAAAPAVLQGIDVPDHPDGLAALPWLALRTYYRTEVSLTHDTTGETRRFSIRPRISTDSLFALRGAAVQGLGAFVGSSWLFSDDLAQGRLVRLAPRWRAAPLPVYLTYPHAQFYPSRLTRFVAAMREAVPGLIARADV
ncbi:LysR family transcriptional regulator [Paraburkholderia caballeronis]|uniref:DNA-binding transcriptional regulator, LysR family n=1 Tax=Paraburkholderia caballeronis TaxID=416943 RepID=A0A1H7FIW8_9BURK|nr:LysR family transcriptional regulator [Paraburkholderia caballeronis]PXW24970.1 LysR family transcriptional regulator [Paraburkholderia caballeronis]PXX00700.1 LysR family transcriptional regulator [Paraburkholderia caballeronis]RAJ98763.1 LysR family transcriptional regulator [Paraburkholderia caballeronis]SEE72023.1 transcriptional regulator, LysR family [Paraburkholderia caballeronis]SEK25714.1 DNA-binding transcriptional regulator, LysR family [Paraburkholderia caballeronis]